MPPVNRNQPIRANSSDSEYTLMDFMREFPDDKTCLGHLWRERFAPDGKTAQVLTNEVENWIETEVARLGVPE